MSQMTPEQSAEVMAKWGVWMESVGSALSDIGAPFGPGASVIDDGSSGAAAASSGTRSWRRRTSPRPRR